ncbi:MAG: hypothetical protein NZ534_07240, partial [Bacteroidia bacterium]|nr:hypothetical protein [Bacteroidia bacterium]
LPGGPNTPNFSPSPNVTTTYTFRVVDELGCVTEATATVTVVNPPTVTVNAPTAVCRGQSVQLSASAPGISQFRWQPSAGLSDAFSANPTASPTQTTVYTVYGLTAEGCRTPETTVTVSINPPPVGNITAQGGTTTICPGESVTLSASGAAGGSYQWLNATPANNQQVVVSPTTTTVYSVEVTNPAGCKDTAEIAITVAPAPNPVAYASDYEICAGQSVQLFAAGAESVVWLPAGSLSPNNTSFTPVATPVVTTTYTVGASVGNCTEEVQVTITVHPNPTFNPTSTQAPNASISVNGMTGTPPFTVSLLGPVFSTHTNVSGPSDSFTNLPAGQYRVRVTDANGCTTEIPVTVNAQGCNLAVQTSAPTAICPGGQTTLSVTNVAGAQGEPTYLWQPDLGIVGGSVASANIVVQPPSSVTYTVTVTDGGLPGCQQTATIPVTIHTPPSGIANATPIPNATVTISPAGSGPFTINLSGPGGVNVTLDNQPGPTVVFANQNINISGEYTATITDANGCTTTITVNVPPAGCNLTVSAGADFSVCAGTTANLTAAAAGGAGIVAFAWSGAELTGNVNAANVVAVPTQSRTYTVTATDANGCTAQDQITVGVWPAVTMSSSATQAPAATITVVPVGGTAPFTVVVTGPNAFNQSDVAAPYQFGPAEVGVYNIVVTDANGCTATGTQIVSDTPCNLTLNTPATVARCPGETFEITATAAGASGGVQSYVWLPTTFLNPPFNGATVTGTTGSPGTYTYTVTATDGAGCTASSQTQVTIFSPPTISANATALPNATLTATPGGGLAPYTVTMTDPSGTSSVDATPPYQFSGLNLEGIYTVAATDANGCRSETSLFVGAQSCPPLAAIAFGSG